MKVNINNEKIKELEKMNNLFQKLNYDYTDQ